MIFFTIYSTRTYLCMAVLGLHCYMQASLVVASGGYSEVVVRGPLLAVALLLWSMGCRCEGFGRCSTQVWLLQHRGLVVAAGGF